MIKNFFYYKNDEVGYSDMETLEITEQLHSGMYKLFVALNEMGFEVAKIKIMKEVENIKNIDFPQTERLDTLFSKFLDKDIREKVMAKGFAHKLGIMLYGTYGTGKSTIIRNYCKKSVEESNALVFYMDYKNEFELKMIWKLVEDIRKNQDNPIIIVVEEFDNKIYEVENIWKQILDGHSSINNVMTIATTNHINLIPDAIKNRPSRFKELIELKGIENPKTIEEIIVNIVNDIDEDSLKEAIKTLKGKTLDDIKEYALSLLMEVNIGMKIKNKVGFK